jgi:hypothetical protein
MIYWKKGCSDLTAIFGQRKRKGGNKSNLLGGMTARNNR